MFSKLFALIFVFSQAHAAYIPNLDLKIGGASPSATNPLAVRITADGLSYTSPIPVALSASPLPINAATESTLAAFKTAVGIPLQAGSTVSTSITNTPTVNLGTLNGAATAAGVATVNSTLGSPFQAGGSIGNTSFICNAGTNLNTSALALESTQSAQNVLIGVVTETAPATDTASSGLNGRLQRVAQRISSLITTIGSPFQAGGSIGNTAFGISGTLPAFTSTPTFNVGTIAGIAMETTLAAFKTAVGTPIQAGSTVTTTISNTPTVNLGTLNGAATAAGIATVNTTLGSPFQAGGSIGNTAFGISGTLPAFASTPTFNIGTISTIATEATQSAQSTLIGAVTETAPTTDTASSGLNGRLQRVAQRLTSLITTLGSPFQAGGSIGNTSFIATQTTGTNLHAVIDSGSLTATISGTPTVTANAGTNLNTSLLALDSTVAKDASLTTLNTSVNSLLKPASTLAAVTSITNTVTVAGTVTANAGTNLNTSALALDATLTGGTQRSKVTDGINNAAVKAASTAAVATDPALVVALSPNNTVPASIAGNVTVVQPTGTNLHSVIDSGIVTVSQATGTNLHSVIDSGTVTANLGTLNGASTAVKQPALGTAGTPSADVITVQGATSMTPLASNVTQLGGATPSATNSLPMRLTNNTAFYDSRADSAGNIQTLFNLNNAGAYYVPGCSLRQLSNGPPVEIGVASNPLYMQSSLSFPLYTTPSRSANTFNSPGTVTVGNTSATYLTANASRKGLSIQNLSNNTECFGFGVAAVLNSGKCLFPGGTYEMDSDHMFLGAINAIASAASSASSYQEEQ